MTGIDILRFQLDGSLNVIRDRIEAVAEEDWDRPVVPGASRIGFILFHCARTFDWTVHTAVQGVPEVAESPAWRDRLAPDALFGAGIPDAVADTVPAIVSRATLLEYVEALRAAVSGWVSSLRLDSLDFPVDLRARLERRPEYLAPAVWAEVESLAGIPAWQVLARPGISHIRVHAGEADLLTQIARARTLA